MTNFHGKWTYSSFPVSAVKCMQFTAINPGRRGGSMGLAFLAYGKKHKALEGLEAPEANTILEALQNLYVDTMRDPAMPMMVEMAESKRK